MTHDYLGAPTTTFPWPCGSWTRTRTTPPCASSAPRRICKSGSCLETSRVKPVDVIVSLSESAAMWTTRAKFTSPTYTSGTTRAPTSSGSSRFASSPSGSCPRCSPSPPSRLRSSNNPLSSRATWDSNSLTCRRTRPPPPSPPWGIRPQV